MNKYKAGAIRFWGQWYGRPFDDFYEVSHVELDEQNSSVIVKFSNSSELQAYGIRNFVFESGTFVIESADKIIWSTSCYDEEGAIKYMETYIVVGGQVLLTNNRTDDLKEYKPEGFAFEVVSLF